MTQPGIRSSVFAIMVIFRLNICFAPSEKEQSVHPQTD